MGKLTTLLFDVDGTLADTEEIHRQAFNRAFHQAGLDWEWSPRLYRDLLAVTGGRERIRHYLAVHRPGFEPPMNLDEYIAGLHAAKTDIYTRRVAGGGLSLRPGVLRLIREARERGLRLGIATTTTPANVQALLEHAIGPEALAWFDVIAAGNQVPEKKPAPDIYQYAMGELGAGPEQCLAIEDSDNGLHAALGAGLETLVTVNPFTEGHVFEDALLVTDGLGEPDRPLRVLSGRVGYDRSCIDVDGLLQLHAAGRYGVA
ncbi:MAG TPA: HAD family hydrolase [Gammaproteobacteria bacterium]|nr:HAD family hydrolase [Gammaproteobacteria bacterium]